MTQRSDPGHPLDLTQLNSEQLQALANDVLVRLNVSEFRLPPISSLPPEFFVTQHGLRRSEAERLVRSYLEFSELLERIDFQGRDHVVFRKPFPEVFATHTHDQDIAPSIAPGPNQLVPFIASATGGTNGIAFGTNTDPPKPINGKTHYNAKFSNGEGKIPPTLIKRLFDQVIRIYENNF
jgi:hypothetical protein